MLEIEGEWTVDWGEAGAVDIESRDPSGALPPACGAATRIGHVSDFHLGSTVESGRPAAVVGRWLEAMVDAGVDVAVVTGDLVEEPADRVGLLRIRHLLESADLEWVVVPGNHDIAEPGCDRTFEELFGGYPRIESVAGAQFGLLDSMGRFEVGDRGPFERLIGETFCLMRGRVGGEQVSAFDDGWEAGRPASPRILAVHHHLAPASEVLGRPVSVDAPESMMVPLLDAERVLERADRWGVRLAFHGHRHRHWPPYVRGNVVVLNSGSAVRGKPERRGRIVDLHGCDRAEIYDVRQSLRDA